MVGGKKSTRRNTIFFFFFQKYKIITKNDRKYKINKTKTNRRRRRQKKDPFFSFFLLPRDFSQLLIQTKWIQERSNVFMSQDMHQDILVQSPQHGVLRRVKLHANEVRELARRDVRRIRLRRQNTRRLGDMLATRKKLLWIRRKRRRRRG